MAGILEPLEFSGADAASVPRRFGVGVLMILMTAFAAIFSGMRTFRASPEVFVIVATLFLAVTLGQILLFEGKNPRAASRWAGAVAFPLVLFAVVLYSRSRSLTPEPLGVFLFGCILNLTVVIPAGILFGYLAGCLMAGVFLALESFHRRSQLPLNIELVPFTAADFDTLIAWVRHLQLFDLWSQGEFHFPLDHGQLAAHLGRTTGTPPRFEQRQLLLPESDAPTTPIPDEPSDRLCFKAVCGEMQQMVGYVELADINRENPSASAESGGRLASLASNFDVYHKRARAEINLAIVDPTRDDRGQLSDALIWETLQHAFNQLGIHWLGVVLDRTRAESIECFRKHGFYDGRRRPSGRQPEKYLELIRSDRY